MVEELFTAIATRLHQVFALPVHRNDVAQSLEEPCFLVFLLRVVQTPQLGNRVRRVYPFDIQYVPRDPTDNVELQGVAEELLGALEYIELPSGDLVRGREIKYELVDGVLHFFIDFGVQLQYLTPTEQMQTLHVHTDVDAREESDTLWERPNLQ